MRNEENLPHLCQNEENFLKPSADNEKRSAGASFTRHHVLHVKCFDLMIYSSLYLSGTKSYSNFSRILSHFQLMVRWPHCDTDIPFWWNKSFCVIFMITELFVKISFFWTVFSCGLMGISWCDSQLSQARAGTISRRSWSQTMQELSFSAVFEEWFKVRSGHLKMSRNLL